MAVSSDPHFNLSWSVDTTVGKVLSISSDIIRTCTSDNVQPLAILACERFGAQLAICSETRLKVEQLARRKHAFQFVKHLEASIGFMSGDAADYFASSDAGARFLGLATVLYSLGTNFQAAQALHYLLDQFSSADQMLPTIIQLKDLFEALEPKLKCSGFTDILLGWSILIFSPGSVMERICLPTPHLVGRVGVASTNLGYFPCNECPTAPDIGKMIKAMSEIQRIGQAVYAIFSIPADFAVWVIGLVRWCMGKPPSIRRKPQAPSGPDQPEKGDLHQQDTQIMVQIGDLGSKTVHIQVFKALDGLETLWDVQSHTFKSSPWTGMVSPKIYIQHRVLELQKLHKLNHVSQFMVMLATEIGERVVSSERSLAVYSFRPFLPSTQTIALFKRLLPIDDRQEFKMYEAEKLLPLWRENSRDAIEEAAFLFIELLTIALVENIYDEEPGFYIDIKCRILTRGAFLTLRKTIVDFILSSEFTLPVAPFLGVHQMALNMTGTLQRDGLTDPLISARNGQVLFLSLLETMELPNPGPLRFRVFPGLLLYEGQRYSYAEAEDLTVLGDMLNVEKVDPSDFANDATNMDIVKRPNNKWFCTKDDDFLNLYFAPDLEKDYSVWPHLFIHAPQYLIPNNPCPTPCPSDMGALKAEVTYCQTLAAAISESDPRMIRVLQSVSSRGKGFLMFMLGVFAHIWLKTNDALANRIRENTVVLVQGEACLTHACFKAEKVLRKEFGDQDLGMKRAIIIQ